MGWRAAGARWSERENCDGGERFGDNSVTPTMISATVDISGTMHYEIKRKLGCCA